MSLLVVWHKAHSTVPCRGSGKYKRPLVLAAAVTVKTGSGLDRSLFNELGWSKASHV